MQLQDVEPSCSSTSVGQRLVTGNLADDGRPSRQAEGEQLVGRDGFGRVGNAVDGGAADVRLMTSHSNQVRVLGPAHAPPNPLQPRSSAFPLVRSVVGLGGLEPPASSLSATYGATKGCGLSVA